MPRPPNMARVVVNGSFPSGETFAYGWWMNSVVASSAAAQIAANDIYAQLSTVGPIGLVGYLRNDCSYTGVDYYGYVATTGAAVYVGNSTGAPIVGTGVGASLPLQTAAVATLRTSLAGRRNRGRMYIPVSGANLAAHQFANSDTGQIGTAVRAYLTAVNNLVSVPGSVCVMSQVVGEEHTVLQVFVDSRPDIQRRRAQGQVALFSDLGSI